LDVEGWEAQDRTNAHGQNEESEARAPPCDHRTYYGHRAAGGRHGPFPPKTGGLVDPEWPGSDAEGGQAHANSRQRSREMIAGERA